MLEEAGIIPTIRSTITGEAAHRMPEMVRDVALYSPSTRYLMLEAVGRCGRTDESASDEAFVAPFLEAVAVAKEHGIALRSSGWFGGIQFRNAFCATFLPSVSFTPTGLITACTRASRLDQTDYTAGYIFGFFDPVRKEFRIDQEKVLALRESATVFSQERCAACPARWHCAGGCPIKRDSGEDTCALMFALFKVQLLEDCLAGKLAGPRWEKVMGSPYREAQTIPFPLVTIVGLAWAGLSANMNDLATSSNAGSPE
jgi:radical SAM protein with 4Fe4S-binding SPASM domain